MITKSKKRNPSKNYTKKNSSRLDDIERVASDLDEIGRRHLPDGVIPQGILRGCEAEIRQEALLLAVGGFLQRNPGFRDASAKRDDEAIGMATERCMAIALQITKRRIASRLAKENERMKPLTEATGGMCEHPTSRHPCDWPVDVKADIIMRSVVTAVSQGKLSVSNATIISMVCERGMRVEEVAKAARISRSAVYQQIYRVRRVIPEIINHNEMFQI